MPVATNLYNGLIPQPNDQISVSQGQLLNNFGANQTFVDINHIDYANADAGKHFYIQMPVSGSSWPSALNVTPTLSATEIGLFNQNAAPTNIPDIWLKRGTAAAYPMTGYSISNGGDQGWAYLPGGVLMAWGFASIVAGGNIVITYTSAGGAGTNFPGFAMQGTPLITRFRTGTPPADAFVYLQNYTNLNFTVYSSTGGNNVSFSWIAIGI